MRISRLAFVDISACSSVGKQRETDRTRALEAPSSVLTDVRTGRQRHAFIDVFAIRIFWIKTKSRRAAVTWLALGHGCRGLVGEGLLTDIKCHLEISDLHLLHQVRHRSKLRIIGDGMIRRIRKVVSIDEKYSRRLTVDVTWSSLDVIFVKRHLDDIRSVCNSRHLSVGKGVHLKHPVVVQTPRLVNHLQSLTRCKLEVDLRSETSLRQRIAVDGFVHLRGSRPVHRIHQGHELLQVTARD